MAKIFLFSSFLMLISYSLCAQVPSREELLRVDEKDWFLENEGQDQDQFLLKDQYRSFIDWENLDTLKWLSYRNWLKERKMRDQDPDWKIKLRNTSSRELMGVIIQCAGKCTVARAESEIIGQYRTKLYEGDEIFSDKNSVAWVLLFDGSLVRLSPQTSMTFLEVNIAQNELFTALRLHHGQMSLIPRFKGEMNSFEAVETDAFVLPLALKEANRLTFARADFFELGDQDKIAAMLKTDYGARSQQQEINRYLKETQFYPVRRSHYMLVMPNTTLIAQDAIMHLYYAPAGKAWFKASKEMEHFKLDDTLLPKAQVYYRGHNNTQTEELNFGHWYSMDKTGRELNEAEKLDPANKLGYQELFIKHVPSIWLAREIMWQKYFAFMALDKEAWTAESIGQNEGYYLWNAAESAHQIQERLSFLIDYFRRQETVHLSALLELYPGADEQNFDLTYIAMPLKAYILGLKDRQSIEFMRILEMSDTQFHFWTHRYGNKHFQSHSR